MLALFRGDTGISGLRYGMERSGRAGWPPRDCSRAAAAAGLTTCGPAEASEVIGRSALSSWGRLDPAAAGYARTAAAELHRGVRAPRRLPPARCAHDEAGPTPPCPCRGPAHLGRAATSAAGLGRALRLLGGHGVH